MVAITVHFDSIEFPRLKTMSLSDNAFHNANKLELNEMNSLQSIELGESTFTSGSVIILKSEMNELNKKRRRSETEIVVNTR